MIFLVLANLKGDDIILCQITSQFIKDDYAITLDNSDFIKGSLNKPSVVSMLKRRIVMLNLFQHLTVIKKTLNQVQGDATAKIRVT